MKQLRPTRGDGAAPSARAARKRRRGRPAAPIGAASFEAVHVPFSAILAEERVIASMILKIGVPPEELGDALQDVYLGAYRSLCAGRYRPPPGRRPRDALVRWLLGIAWRWSLKYFTSARRWQSQGSAWPVWQDPDPERRLAAREALRSLWFLPESRRSALLAVGIGLDRSEIAEAMSVPRGTAATHIYRGRHALAGAIARGKRGEEDDSCDVILRS